GNPLITAVLNQHRARRIVQFSDMVIGGYWRLDFDVRQNTKLRVSVQRGSIPLADVSPEVEEKARAVLEGTAEVTVLALIDFRVENSRENPAVLEKVICRRWLLGAIGQGALRRQPRNEASRAEDSGGRKSRECGHTEDSPGAQQQFDGTARFRTQAGEFILREQFSRANPGQHRQSIGALWIIEYACHFTVALFDDLEDIEVALMGALGAVVCHAHDPGKH